MFETKLSARNLVVISCLVLLSAAFYSDVRGQASPNIALQGSTADSVSDGVDVFSGKLEQIFPLLKIKGRGEIGQGLYLPVRNTEWKVFESATVYSSDRVYHYYRTDQMNYVNIFARAGYQTLGQLAVETRYTGWFVGATQTVTDIKFTTSGGAFTHFRDVLTNGEPYDAQSRGCIFSAYQPPPNPPPAACSRGKVFRATDGSNATFVADANVYDMIFQDVSGPSPFQAQPDIAGTLYLNNGTRIRIESFFNNVTTITDRNGNLMKFEYITETGFTKGFLKKITDSMNREITIVYGDALQGSFYDEIIFKGFGGAERRIRINYTGIGNVMVSGQSLGVPLFPGVHTRCNFISSGAPCDASSDPGQPHYATSLSVPSSIVLPNGKQYQFYYNKYLELARIKSPVGSYTDYSYGGTIGADSDGVDPSGQGIYRRVSSLKNFDENGQLVNEKTFSNIPQYVDTSHPSYPLLDNVTVNVKDNAGTVLSTSRHYFHDSPLMQNTYTFLPMLFGKEYKSEVSDPISGAVLLKTETIWKQRAPFQWCGSYFSLYVCDSVNDPDSGPPVDPRISELKTTLENGEVTKKTYGYDQYNNVIDSSEFDYGSGAPGALLRRTHTDYVTASSYTEAHLLNLPLQLSVFDANNVERARDTFEYDNYATNSTHAGLVDRAGISGFDAAFSVSYGTRGNRTAATQYLLTNGSVTGSITSYTQYDIAGNAWKIIDRNGFESTLDFTDHFGVATGNTHTNSSPVELASAGQASYAFATSATNAIGQISYMKFDYYTSRPVDIQDFNGIISSAYSSNDPLDRLTKTINAVNTSAESQTVFTYNDVNRTVTTTSDLTTNGDGVIVSTQIFDSFGRPIESRQYEGGNNYIVVQQEYDALGRAYRVTNPYRPWQAETAKWSESTFDGLGRLRTFTTPDTAIARTAYYGSQTLLTDQIGKQRMNQTNALGQLKGLWEIAAPDSETEAVSFPGHSEVVTGYRTSYAYDVLGDLTSVTQGSQPARNFAYDSLGRLQAETTPEAGTIGYQYDNVGNLLVRTDARNVSMHVSYDGLNRQVRRWYNTSSSVSSLNHNNPALPSDLGATNEVMSYYDAQALPAGAPSFTRGPSTGRLVATTYGSGSSGDYYGYDAGGGAVLKIQQTEGVNYPITVEHNASGRITLEQYPSGHTVSYVYDATGRMNSFSGKLGDGTQRNYSTGISYSSLGGLSQEQFGTATPIYNKLFYNVRGQLSEIREGITPNNDGFERGAIINFFSSCWGMCANGTMPDNNGTLKRQEHWVKDSNGTVIAINSQDFQYDSLNRIKRTSEGSTWEQQFTYDRYGNRTIDLAHTTASLQPRAFEVQTSTNRLLAPGDTNLAPLSRQMQYDANGNLTVDNYTGQGQRKYDADNHMTNSSTATYSYDSTGQRVRRNLNGVEIWQVYGFGGELLAEYAANAPANSPQKEFGYRNQQLLVVAGTGATTAPAPSALTAAPSSGGGNVVLGWSAAVGAAKYRVERKGASGSFTLAGTTTATTLTDTGASPGSAYLYRVCAANTQDNCTSPFSNMALGAAVAFPTDPTITSSADDPSGVNVTKVKAAHITELRTAVNAVRSLAGLSAAQWTNQTLTATVTIIRADDVRDLRLKLDEALNALGVATSNYDDPTLAGAPNGTLIKKIHITQLRARATSGTGGAGGSSSTAFTVQWLVQDQLGTPRMIFDDTGSLTNTKRHDYLPFGEELLAGGRATTPGYGTPDGVRQKFTGYERDEETGLDFAQARYYASVQGRFTSPDPFNGSIPIFHPQSLNRYSYVANNPLILTDPSGMTTIEHGIDLAFWGENAQFLPGFDTAAGGHIGFYESQYERSMYKTIGDAIARETAKNNAGGASLTDGLSITVWFIGYKNEQGILYWWNDELYMLPWTSAGNNADAKPVTATPDQLHSDTAAATKSDKADFWKVSVSGYGRLGLGLDLGLIVDRKLNLYITTGPAVGVSMLPVNFSLEEGWAYDKDGKHVTTPKAVRQQIEGISVGYKITTPTTDVIGKSGNIQFYHFGPYCCSGYTKTIGHGSPQASVGLNFTTKIIIPFVSN